MKVKLLDKRLTPDMLGYKTEGSAGIDLYILPNTTKDVITSNGYHTFRSGIAIEIPEGFVGIILPRSSSSALGIALANTAGVIDSDFRGEILFKIFKWNKDAEDIEVKAPMRIAQLLIMPVIQVELDFVDELSKTERGVNGWGSTGIN